ncbi:hypothetical protein GCM10010327_21900 [Streptomyces nitrosporeus]|nr:hypothetical protein GCM10010327_21900 [Streptomyces nitrosporeus]
MRVVRGVAGDRTAVLCLTGLLVSGFGTSAMWLTAGIWVKSLTGSDTWAGLTVFAMWAPVLAGPALGALADRLPRRGAPPERGFAAAGTALFAAGVGVRVLLAVAGLGVAGWLGRGSGRPPAPPLSRTP